MGALRRIKTAIAKRKVFLRVANPRGEETRQETGQRTQSSAGSAAVSMTPRTEIRGGKACRGSGGIDGIIRDYSGCGRQRVSKLTWFGLELEFAN